MHRFCAIGPWFRRRCGRHTSYISKIFSKSFKKALLFGNVPLASLGPGLEIGSPLPPPPSLPLPGIQWGGGAHARGNPPRNPRPLRSNPPRSNPKGYREPLEIFPELDTEFRGTPASKFRRSITTCHGRTCGSPDLRVLKISPIRIEIRWVHLASRRVASI